jgi:hypothetical protein
MFSPTKAIAVGALVLAIGGALLVAEPYDRRGDGAPGAATEPMDPVTFTADAALHGSYVQAGCESSDGVLHCRDEFQMAVDASDPRASGTLTYGLNRDTHSLVNVHAGTVTIENDDGMWVGTFTGYWDQQGARIFHAQLAGQDGYEGWTMLLDDFCACDTPASEMQGVIFPGDLPAAE